MTDTVDIQKILSRLSPQQEDKLRKLAADPEALDALGRQIREDVERRAAERAAEMAQIEARAAEKRAVVEGIATVFGKMSTAMDHLSATLDRIQQSDAQRLALAAMNEAAHFNGKLTFNYQKFRAALSAGGKHDPS
jgi:CHASE3 domain sensor protein